MHCFYFTVTAQEAKGPGIVIVHPGQDVELLCTVANADTSSNYTLGVAWEINHIRYGIETLHNNVLAGYFVAGYFNPNVIVENIVMNDKRNNTEHKCLLLLNRTRLLNKSDPTILYVAGEYQ